MKETFLKTITELIPDELIEKINSKGELYLVGGGVRDFFITNKVRKTELDFLVIGFSLDELQKTLRHYGTAIYVGKAFGVLKFFPKGNEKFEYDFTIPETRGCELPEIIVDLAQRDFSINAMALSLKTGTLYDPFGGRSDIEDKIVRLTREGNFDDDPIRLLRAIRFAAQFGFRIEDRTWEDLCGKAEKIKEASAERIREEFLKILMLPDSPSAFRLMREAGLLKYILPELHAAYGVKQGGLHQHDVFEHTILAVKYADSDPRVKLAALLHDLGKPAKRITLPDGHIAFYGHDLLSVKIARRFLQELKFPTELINDVTTIIRYHMFSYGFSDKGLRRFIRRVGVERMPLLLKLRFADSMAQHEGKTLRDEKLFAKRVLEEINRKPPLTVRDLAVNGYDIMGTFSLQQGKIIGDILKYLLSLVLDNPELNKKEILLQAAREYLAERNMKTKIGGGLGEHSGI